MALQNLGHEIIGACEIDKYARSVYAKHFPGVPIYNDATTLQPESLPHFDLLCGGFPCQAFSVAGKRRGFDDCRGTLFFEIARIAKAKKPRYLFLENVRGLLNHNKGETFRTILSTLDEMGYDAEWQVINGKYFLPQNRERIFIIGHLRGQRSRQIFPLGDCNEINNGKIKKVTGYSQCSSVYESDGLSPTISACTHGYAIGNIIEPEIKYHNTSDSQWKRIYDENGICPTLGVGRAMQSPNILAWSKSTRDWGVESRIKLGESNTLSCGDGCGNQSTQSFVLKDKRIRRLTPLECERLQGFPDGWTEGLSDTQRYKCLGNAVMVSNIEYIAKHFPTTETRKC